MFTTQDVADYYNTTQIHYEKWWNLKNALSLHYGIWEQGISTFTESLANTNRVLMELGQISSSDKVLDAGCGVGGAAIFLAKEKGSQVTGITLSEKQVAYAKRISQRHGVENKVSFALMDYTQTSFEDETFDVVWACESISSATDKALFVQEAFRLLKSGGRLILSDFFLKDQAQEDPGEFMQKWGETWGISHFVTSNAFIHTLKETGFTKVDIHDYTEKIVKSAQRMYYASLLGLLPSEIYNFFHPKVSRFASTHYRSGYYQYKALKKDLWKYNILLAIK